MLDGAVNGPSKEAGYPSLNSPAFAFLPFPTIVVSSDCVVSAANYVASSLLGIPPHSTAPGHDTPLSKVLDLPVFLNEVSTLRRHFGVILPELFETFNGSRRVPNANGHETSHSPPSTESNHARDVLVVLPSRIDPENGLSPERTVHMRLLINLWKFEGENYATVAFMKPESIAFEAFVNAKPKPLMLGEGLDVVSAEQEQYLNTKPQAVNRQHESGQKDSLKQLRITPTSNLPTSLPERNDIAAKADRLMKAALQYRAGRQAFILSADNSLFMADYEDDSSFSTLAVGDPELFFGKWEFWDSAFTNRLAISEYPLMLLNRTRKDFEAMRYGTLSASGTKLLFEASGECLYESSTKEYLGGLVWARVLGTVEEIAAKEKQEYLKSFKTVCESLPHLIWTTKPNGTLDYFTDSFYDFTGYKPSTSLDSSWDVTIHPEDYPLFKQRFQESIRSGIAFQTEVRIIRPDRSYTWMMARAKPLKNPDGKVLKIYGSLTDIHNTVVTRIHAEKAHKQQMAVLGHAEVLLWKVNTDWVMPMLEGETVWTYASDNENDKATVTGSNLIEYLLTIEEDGCPGFIAAVDDVLSGRKSSTIVEWPMANKWFRARIIAEVENSSIVGCLGCTIDVTEARVRSKLEMENVKLQYTRKMAEDSNRLKSQFLANMSHEIRTPIAGILGIAELLQTDTHMDEQQTRYVEDILISARSLLTIINDILDFSKVESGKLQIESTAYNVRPLIDDVCRIFVPTARQKSKVKFIYDINKIPDLELLGDPARIRQILLNIIGNSWKFTTKGSIALSVRREQNSQVIDATDVIHFEIHDTGIGIAKEFQAKLFTPFCQEDASTARRYGGTGLGLTISKNLARLMGGVIDLKSELDVGTTVTLTIPVVFPKRVPIVSRTTSAARTVTDRGYHPITGVSSPNGNDQERTPETINTNAPRLGPTTSSTDSYPPSRQQQQPLKPVILIVEDNALNAHIATRNVEKLGYATASAANGLEALEYLSSQDGEKVCLVLMDCQMPLMDGYEATQALRKMGNDSAKHLEQLPVIALTASAIQGDREKCLESGMNDYLSKPFSRNDLSRMLDRWLKIKPV